MRVAISVTKPEHDAELDMRFGRAAAFLLIDTETGEWQGHTNPAASAPGGAGVQAAEFIVRQGAEAAISGAFGPKAFNVLAAAGVVMYRSEPSTAKESMQKLKDGELEPVETPRR